MSGIPAWARPGVEVAFVGLPKDLQALPGTSPFDPKVGEVCVVERVIDERAKFGNPRAVFIRLAGWPDEYIIECFRPVTKRTQEQDIAEHFRDLLTVRAPEGADA